MAKLPVPSKPDKIKVDCGDWEAAYGDFVCPDCGCMYREHVYVPGYRWLRRLCDGTFVKLIG